MLVTATGHELLTAGLPRTTAEIEHTMRRRRPEHRGMSASTSLPVTTSPSWAADWSAHRWRCRSRRSDCASHWSKPSQPAQGEQHPSFDERTTALANGTVRAFRTLGVWAGMEREAAPIRKIHISDQGRFGTARIDAAEQGLEALGYVVPNRVIGAALWDGLVAGHRRRRDRARAGHGQRPARAMSVSSVTNCRASRASCARDSSLRPMARARRFATRPGSRPTTSTTSRRPSRRH